MTFTALDFETAQGPKWSICQVGIVRVENGKITHEYSQLVQPPDNYYWLRWSGIHGITARDTRHAPTFAECWPSIEPFIAGQIVVAHNAAFDVSCLKQALSLYGITCPPFETRCTYKHFKKGLAEICAEHRIPLNHHDALSDARACARLALLASLSL
jgi:DNA polymerase III subunit epsilon